MGGNRTPPVVQIQGECPAAWVVDACSSDGGSAVSVTILLLCQEIGFCTAPDGVRIAFATSGSGPAVVRVGTWLSHLEEDWNSSVWRHWLEAFSEGRTLVRFDVRGSGLSDRRVDDLSLDALVNDLDAVVDASGLERFPLLGLCPGGPIAIAYAARYPARVTRLVLYDAYLGGNSQRRALRLRSRQRPLNAGFGAAGAKIPRHFVSASPIC